MEKEEWEVSLPRKLTPDELSSLKDQIRPLIDQEAGEEYVSDVLEYACSMVNNLKSINYVVKELIEMEFDFLPTSSVEKIAEQIQIYMASVAGGTNAGGSDDNNNTNYFYYNYYCDINSSAKCWIICQLGFMLF